MQNKRFSRSLLCLLCIVLIAVTACMASGCNGNNPVPSGDTSQPPVVKGEGSTVFTFIAADLDGNETVFEIHTDQTTVGAALQQVGLIQGDEGAYGLYVKSVNGITLDYDTHGKYWAFYVNGGYAPSGVDQTEIKADETYAFAPAS